MLNKNYNKTFRDFFSKFEKKYFDIQTTIEEKDFLWALAVNFVEKNRDFVMQYPLVDYWDYIAKNNYKLRNILKNYSKKDVNLYIHIPFCKTRCTYCNFHIVAGDRQKELKTKLYLENIKEEINYFLTYTNNTKIKTLFIGGGTPSYLDVDHLKNLLGFIEKNLGKYFDKNIEFSFEGNPDSFNIEKFKLLKKYGVNRISIGMQTFDNSIIKNINRTYDKDILLKRIDEAKSLGLNNINVDMIYGLPGHNYNIMKNDLIKISTLDISHITYYPLYYYNEALLSKIGYKENNIKYIYKFYDEIVKTLERNGFIQYGREYFCKNNLIHNYQNNFVSNKLLYGFGHSAYSFNGETAFYKKQRLQDYLISKNKLEKMFVYNSEDLDRRLFVLGSRNINIEKSNIKNLEKTKKIFKLALKLDLIKENKDCFYLTQKGIKYQEILAHMFL